MSQTDDDKLKTIKTAKGEIKWLPKKKEIYLNKSTLIFGGTGSGKTRLIEEALFLMKDDIPNYLVIADENSKDAYKNKLPARCIKDDLTKKQLTELWDRQKNLTSCCKIANEINNLEALYSRIATLESQRTISSLNDISKYVSAKIERNPNLTFAQKKDLLAQLTETSTNNKREYFKQRISANEERLKQMELNNMESITLKFYDVNPRLCVILDDVSDKFKKWMGYFNKSKEINPFNGIFFQGRHNNITLLFAAHDDKIIDSELRKNARVIMFANIEALNTYITRPNNGFNLNDKKKIAIMASAIYDEADGMVKKYQKFCYLREDPSPFRYTVAGTYPDFELGSAALRNLIQRLPNKEADIFKNKYAREALVH